MRLYDDKKPPINIAHNLIKHDGTTHEMYRHYMKKLDSELIFTPYIFTRGYLVDILT